MTSLMTSTGNISSDAIQIVEDFQRELNHFLTNAQLDEHLNSLGSPSFKVNHTLVPFISQLPIFDLLLLVGGQGSDQVP